MNKRNSIGLDPERLENYEAEAEEIIRRLKTDPKFCHDFFYGTKTEECNMARLRSGVLGYLEQNYHIVMSAECFNSLVFQTLWSEGTWAALDTYEKQCTFFAWLKKVARNAVLERLEEEGLITMNCTRTTGNTRLALLSQTPEKCQLIIDEQMRGSKYHDLMSSVYVSRLSKEEIVKSFGMTEQEFETTKSEGEYELKDALLRSSCCYEEEVLRNKTRNNLTVSSEFVADMEEWINAKMGENPLADVFGVNLTDQEVHERVLDFLYGFSAELNWSEQDRDLWRQRFINNTSPVELAEALGKSRAWVDTRYSRLNKKFEMAIKKWWHTHAE